MLRGVSLFYVLPIIFVVGFVLAYGMEPSDPHRPLRAMLWALGAVLAIGTPLAVYVTIPLRRLLNAVERYGPDTPGFRVPTELLGQLGTLGRRFNEVAVRLEDALAQVRVERDRAERSEALRREFMADVSHGLRTPLTAILGWSDMLVEGVATDPVERAQLLGRIRREVCHVSRCVGQLLDLSRLEVSAPALHLEAFPLVESLMEVVQNLEDAAAENDVRLLLDPLDPTLRVRADRAATRDILQVLLENVVAHAGRGVTARVSIAAADARVYVSIEDDGVGISQPCIDTLRERHHPSTGRGLGLGLAIAVREVEAHGGHLCVERRAEGGTRACFDLAAAETAR